MRANSHLPKPGAGRPPKYKDAPPAAEPPIVVEESAVEFLRQVMQGSIVPTVPQLEAAKLLARLEVAPKGKKEAADEAAGKVAAGKFGARPAPLKVVGGKAGG
jgi:hypothetical protein